MKYAILSDIHANLEALEAVLDDAKKNNVSQYACAGDIVGYNADPKECLKILRKLKATTVQGNHDYYAASKESIERFSLVAKKSILWTRKKLSYQDRNFLCKLPITFNHPDFTLVHSSLNNPRDWGYVFNKNSAKAHFKNQFSNLCFIGHTHVPLIFKNGEPIENKTSDYLQLKPNKQYLINVGSVGQPRDRNPNASYVIYDSTEQVIQIRRIKYDIETTQKKVREAALPFRNALRLKFGK